MEEGCLLFRIPICPWSNNYFTLGEVILKKNVRVLTTTGVLTALSLMFELSFAIPLIVSFLFYAPGDLPILFITYLFGVIPGIIAVAINATLFVVFRPPDAVPIYGLIMHFVASSAFVSVFAIFARSKKMVHIITGLSLGTVARALIMIPANLFLTPYYLKATTLPNNSIESLQLIVKGMIVPAIIPFNLLHSGINSILFILLYIPLKSLLDNRKS
jgi:riboflavin transporter FmnP